MSSSPPTTSPMQQPLPRPAEGDVDISYKLKVSTTVTFLAATLIVALRVWARAAYARIGWDDIVMVFAVMQALVATIMDYVAANWGLGRHTFFLTPEERVKQAYFGLLAQVFCIHALTFAKISICLTCVRLIKGTQKTWLRWLCHSISISVFVVNSLVIISFYARCLPSEKVWNPKIQGTCWKPEVGIGFIVLQGVYSALTDFILCVIPVFIIKDLQIGGGKKLILCSIMGLGLITGIFAAIRTSSIGLKAPPPDASYEQIMGLTWAGMERNLAILLSSIPAIRPLSTPVSKLTSRTFTRLRSSKKDTTHDYELHGSKGSSLPKAKFGIDVATPSKASSLNNTTTYSKGSAMRSTNSQERILPVQGHEVV